MMAKRKAKPIEPTTTQATPGELPPGAAPVAVEPTLEPPATIDAEPAPFLRGVCTLEMPLLDIKGYHKRRLDTACTGRQARGWKAIAEGLSQREERLLNGKYIRSSTDAIRWVGEQIAIKLEELQE